MFFIAVRGKMTEPEPIYEIDTIKKRRVICVWRCKNCSERIGDIVRVNKIRRLVKDNGEWWEGHGVVRCDHCGELRRWIPGQEHLDQIIKKDRSVAPSI